MRRFGLDYATLAADHPAPDLRVDLRLRPDRARRGEGRIRSRRARRLRADVGHRRAGRAAGEGRRAAHRSRRGALRARRRFWRRCTTATRTGRGQYIDTSLLEAGVALSVWEADRVSSPAAACRSRWDRRIGMIAPYQAIRCADGYITLARRPTIGCSRGSARCSGIPSGATIPTSPTTRARPEPRGARRAIEAVTARTAARALARAASRRTAFPAGRSTTTSEVFADPQVWRAAMVVEIDHPTPGPHADARLADEDVGDAAGRRRRAPLLGEHTEEVLREASSTSD